jgi:hypothetical protein
VGHILIYFSVVAFGAIALTPNNAGAKNVGNGKALQFTTGGCTANADCAEGCCAGGAVDASGNAVGICSGIGAEHQNGKTGCGFVDPNAAQSIANAQKISKAQGF